MEGENRSELSPHLIVVGRSLGLPDRHRFAWIRLSGAWLAAYWGFLQTRRCGRLCVGCVGELKLIDYLGERTDFVAQ